MTNRIIIKTYNKYQTPLSVGQSSIPTICQSPWMRVIARNHKNGCCDIAIQHRKLKQKPNTTNFGTIFNFYVLLVILDNNHKSGCHDSNSQHRDL